MQVEYSDPQKSGSFFTKSKKYLVLEVLCVQAKVKYRVVSDDNDTPVLKEATFFKVTDSRIPSNWVAIFNNEKDYFYLGPKSWDVLGFWEDYFNFVPEAVKIFEEEKNIIDKECS